MRDRHENYENAQEHIRNSDIPNRLGVTLDLFELKSFKTAPYFM